MTQPPFDPNAAGNGAQPHPPQQPHPSGAQTGPAQQQPLSNLEPGGQRAGYGQPVPLEKLKPVSRKTGLIAAVIAVAVIVAIAAVVVPLTVLRGGSGGSGITVENFAETPEVGTWSITGPAGAPEDSEALVIVGHTTAQDRALITWQVLESPDRASIWVSMVDTGKGEEIWSTRLDANATSAFSAVAAYRHRGGLSDPMIGDDYAYLTVAKDVADSRDVIVDLATGESHDLGDWLLIGRSDTMGSDYIAWHPSDREVARFSVGQEEPEWSVSTSAESRADLIATGEVLLDGEQLLDLRDGSELEWAAKDDAEYGSVGPLLMAVEDGEIAILDPLTGETRWSIDLEDNETPYPFGTMTYVASPQPMLLYSGSGDTTITAFDPSDGRELWENRKAGVPSRLAADDLLIVRLPGDWSTGRAVDLRTGETVGQFKSSVSGLGDCVVEAATDELLYLAGFDCGEDVGLKALSTEDFEEQWTVPLPGNGGYIVLELGGRLVATKYYPGDKDEAGLIGIG